MLFIWDLPGLTQRPFLSLLTAQEMQDSSSHLLCVLILLIQRPKSLPWVPPRDRGIPAGTFPKSLCGYRFDKGILEKDWLLEASPTPQSIDVE